MNSWPYALLYLLTAGAAATLGWYGWQRREYREARIFVALMLALVVWSTCHAISIASISFSQKIAWARLQYIGVVAVPPTWLLFGIAYDDRWEHVTRKRIIALFVPAVLALAAVLTDSIHQLWWTEIRHSTSLPYDTLDPSRGPLFWAFTLYAYTCILVGIGFFFDTLIDSPLLYRRQAGLIVAAGIIPLLGNLLLIVGVRIPLFDDPTPFLFVVSCMMFWYATLRYRLLSLAPIAQREIMEELPDGVLVLSKRGRIMMLNDAARTMLSLDHEQVIGQTLESIAGTEQLRDLLDTTTMQSRQATFEDRRTERVFEMRTRPLMVRDGNRSGTIILLRDMTELVRAQQARNQRLNELTVLNQIASATNAAIDPDDLLRLISGEAVRGLQWDRVAISLLREDQSSLEVIIDERVNGVPSIEGQIGATSDFPILHDSVNTRTAMVLQADAPLPDDDRTLQMMRQVGMATSVVVPLYSHERTLGLLIMGSTTPRKLVPSDILLFETIGKLVSDAIVRTRLYEEARAMNAMKSLFIATVSHELRTPLTSIIGFTDMLRRGMFGPFPERSSEAIEHIARSGQQLLRLINDILDYSKMEAGHLAIDMYPVDVNALVQAVAASLQPQIAARNLALEMELDTVPPAKANSTRVEQVLTNIIANAIKFTDIGTIRVKTAETPAGISISITDSGIGIAPEDQEAIFQAFRQIDSPHTRRAGGTGLGLAISRRLIELMGGTLALESTVGTGTTFICTLPPAIIPGPETHYSVAEHTAAISSLS